jgi:hypothetical protein
MSMSSTHGRLVHKPDGNIVWAPPAATTVKAGATMPDTDSIDGQLASDRVAPLYNGKYTITSPTGEHRTFEVRTVREGNLAGKRIVAMLTGPDNQTDYKGFGFVNDAGIKVWRKVADSGDFFQKVAKMLWVMGTTGSNNEYARRGCTLQLSKRCVKCNRELTDPTSISLGIGPVCRSGRGEDK